MKFRLSALFLILLVAAGLRLWQIDSLPPGFHFDESFEGLEAWRILTDPGYRPLFLAGNFGVPPLNAYANAVTFGLFQAFGGQIGPVAMRTTAAVAGLLGILALYALAGEMRRHDDRLPPLFPLFAAAGLALMRWHIHFSRMGIEPIFVPLLWTVGTWLLLRSWRTGSLWSFAATGVALALPLYTYQAAWILPFLALFGLAVLVWKEPKSLGRRWIGVLVSGGVALALVAPLLAFFWRHPDLMLMRPQQVSAIDAAVTPGQANAWANLWSTVRMFSLWGETGDLDPRRNVPGLPVMTPWLTLPFYAGLLAAAWRARRPVYALILLGLVGMALPGVVTEYAPHFHRILGVAAPTALLVGLGASLPWAFSFGSKWRNGIKVASMGAAILFLIIGGVASANTYFNRWGKLPALYHAFDQGLWEMGQWMAAQPVQTPLYLTPRDAATHPTLGFALLTAPASPIPQRPMPAGFDGRAIFPATAGRTQTAEEYVVIEHEDFRTRLLLPELFPAATVSQTWTDPNGEVYARVYTRPPGSLPMRLPKHPLAAPVGDGIRLLGYDVLPATPRPGETLYVQLHWAVDTPPAQDWTVFVHLLGPADVSAPSLATGKDGPPGDGSLPTTRWQAGWLILDEYQLSLPPELPTGAYALEIGLYRADGAHLPADGPIRLGDLTVGN